MSEVLLGLLLLANVVIFVLLFRQPWAWRSAPSERSARPASRRRKLLIVVLSVVAIPATLLVGAKVDDAAGEVGVRALQVATGVLFLTMLSRRKGANRQVAGVETVVRANHDATAGSALRGLVGQEVTLGVSLTGFRMTSLIGRIAQVEDDLVKLTHIKVKNAVFKSEVAARFHRDGVPLRNVKWVESSSGVLTKF